MIALQLRIVYTHTLWFLIVLHLLPPEVMCDIKAPANLVQNVRQDVVFMWNTTNGNSILSAKWGLLGPDNKTITPQFISISTRTNGPVLSNDLDSTAVMYKGRVSWVGDLSAGHAWFNIANLTIQDTNTYVTAIREQGQSESFQYSIHLTVAVPPQFKLQPPQRKIIAEGQELNLTCTAVGPPIPNITWVQVISHVTKSTGTGSATLRITSIRRDQNGTYKCQARNNPNENPVIAQSVVTVYCRKQSPTQKRKPRSKKAVAEETYENDLELEDNTASMVTASRAQQPVQTGPVYETIQQSNSNKAGSSDSASNYQGLNLFPNTSIQETYGPPLYEPLGTRSVESSMQHNDNKQHPYQPLNIKDQSSTYQSLQTNSRESAI